MVVQRDHNFAIKIAKMSYTRHSLSKLNSELICTIFASATQSLMF